jgi:hypothetical protein
MPAPTSRNQKASIIIHILLMYFAPWIDQAHRRKCSYRQGRTGNRSAVWAVPRSLSRMTSTSARSLCRSQLSLPPGSGSRPFIDASAHDFHGSSLQIGDLGFSNGGCSKLCANPQHQKVLGKGGSGNG